MPGRSEPPQVLLVCVLNAGRSQMAAALLAHHGLTGTEPTRPTRLTELAGGERP